MTLLHYYRGDCGGGLVTVAVVASHLKSPPYVAPKKGIEVLALSPRPQWLHS